MTLGKKKTKTTSRRPYGRLRDAPGPQPSFMGEFQLQDIQTPDVGGGHQAIQGSNAFQSHDPPPVQRYAPFPAVQPAAMPEPNQTNHRGRTDAGPSRPGRQRSNVAVRGASPMSMHVPPPTSAHNSSTSAPRPSLLTVRTARRGAEEDAPGLSPTKRRRASDVRHHATHSDPAEQSMQRTGGSVPRSQSSTVLASEVPSATSELTTGLTSQSWPRDVHAPTFHHRDTRPERVMPLPSVSYRGPDRQAPNTPGSGDGYGQGRVQVQGQGQGQPFSQSPATFDWGEVVPAFPFPSASSPLYHHRGDSYESSNDFSWRHYYSPAPPTPGSMSGASVGPSVGSESSPFLGIVGNFDEDTADAPPLTPDDVPENPLSNPRLLSPHSSQSTVRGDQSGTLEAVHPLRPNLPVFDCNLYFPGGIFGSSQDAFAFSNDPPSPRQRPSSRSPPSVPNPGSGRGDSPQPGSHSPRSP